MNSFKAFIAEIDHGDDVYSKEASNWSTKRISLDNKWQPLPIKGSFWKPGFSMLWKAATHGIFDAVVVYDGKPVVRLDLDTKVVRVPGGELTGIEVESLSSAKEVRGTGLVLRTYEALVESGQVLFSSNAQTSGSRKLWEKLVVSPSVVPFVLAQGAAARWYSNRYKAEPSANVLLSGSIDRMNDEAYADSETRWVALPKDLPGIKALRKGAIDVT